MYNPKNIEPKWQKYWSDHATFATKNPPFADDNQKKFYVLDMFPYPSGTGLHVGHPKGYTATDAYSRYKRAKGFNVLHTMGWDAFGLPAENYAAKTGRHPAITTQENVDIFREQIKRIGLSYDWDREINTTDVEYLKWTQWIFSRIVESGLAYEAEMPVNWCPNLQCVLANEEVVDGKSEVGGHPVEKRNMRQWVLRITEYADQLLEDLDELDWSDGIKEQQRNWIGKSEGCEFTLSTPDDAETSADIAVYTTRVDTVLALAWVVIAPDHPKVHDFITGEQADLCRAYIQDSATKSDQDRLNEGKEKTGVYTGSFVVNPFTQTLVPVWIGDYVLGNYGTGAVMGVPAHDERDFEFAQKYNLPIQKTIASPEEFAEYTALDTKENANEQEEERIEELATVLQGNVPYTQDGYILAGYGENEELLEAVIGLSSSEARTTLLHYAQEHGFGRKKINYKLRDWIFSRQRYWGEPMPIIHISHETIAKLPRIQRALVTAHPHELLGESTTQFESHELLATLHVGDAMVVCIGEKEYFAVITAINGSTVNYTVQSILFHGIEDRCILDHNLPLKLPEVSVYLPSDDGQSPLARATDWLEITVANGIIGHRETNTMPQWAGSCWYYLRFMDPHNAEAFVDGDIFQYWNSVDIYVGGAEHAVLHLLYARFWHKILYNLGILSTKEPFHKLINQGLILGGDGSKMSKSKGNVINPDEVIKEVGADVLRMFILGLGDFRDPSPWNTQSMVGMTRFLEKITAAFEIGEKFAHDDMKSYKLLHKTIKKIEEDIEAFKFNTALSSLIILMNEGMPKDTELQQEWKESFLLLLHPFAPHLAEELWQMIGKKTSIYGEAWPEYDESLLIDDEVVISVQVNGKLRHTITCLRGVAQEEVEAFAHDAEEVEKWLKEKELKRIIYVPNKLINFVVGE